MPYKIKMLLPVLFTITVLISCNGGKMQEQQKVQFPSIKEIPESKWQSLSQKKIYFGHQSVGFNIIDGIKDVMKEYPQIKLNIIETADPAEFNMPIFAHSRVGQNMNPKSKVDAFSSYIHQGIGNMADMSFFKFCYVDVGPETDIYALFEGYKTEILKLQEEYPNIKFIHMTVPLTTAVRTWKTLIKELIGKEPWEYSGNIAKNKYNGLVIKEYEGKEPLFDLAKIESTPLNGASSTFTRNGQTYYSLAQEYTDDGGHLNEKGRKVVAEQLLISLADLK